MGYIPDSLYMDVYVVTSGVYDGYAIDNINIIQQLKAYPSYMLLGAFTQIMKVTLKKAFSLLDGRLSTKIDDVYEMLNYIFDESFMTHQLPSAMRKLQEVNPEWFQHGVEVIDGIKRMEKTNDFEHLMKVIDAEYYSFEIELGKVDAKIGFMDGLV